MRDSYFSATMESVSVYKFSRWFLLSPKFEKHSGFMLLKGYLDQIPTQDIEANLRGEKVDIKYIRQWIFLYCFKMEKDLYKLKRGT